MPYNEYILTNNLEGIRMSDFFMPSLKNIDEAQREDFLKGILLNAKGLSKDELLGFVVHYLSSCSCEGILKEGMHTLVISTVPYDISQAGEYTYEPDILKASEHLINCLLMRVIASRSFTEGSFQNYRKLVSAMQQSIENYSYDRELHDSKHLAFYDYVLCFLECDNSDSISDRNLSNFTVKFKDLLMLLELSQNKKLISLVENLHVVLSDCLA